MASVAEIQARLDQEQGRHRALEEKEVAPVNRPVRKVSYPAIAGAVTAVVLYVLSRYSIVLDPASSGAIVLGIMTLIGYVVPLSDKDLSEMIIKN